MWKSCAFNTTLPHKLGIESEAFFQSSYAMGELLFPLDIPDARRQVERDQEPGYRQRRECAGQGDAAEPFPKVGRSCQQLSARVAKACASRR